MDESESDKRYGYQHDQKYYYPRVRIALSHRNHILTFWLAIAAWITSQSWYWKSSLRF
jgi:hypothetical protein